MQSITWRLVRWYTVILAAILIICGGAAFISMRYLLYNEAAREVKAAITTVKRISTPEEKNLDAPELTASIENGILWVQITTASGKVINNSHALKNAVIAPGYEGPPIIYRFHGQEVFLAGAKLAGGYLVEIARPLNREEGFLKLLAGVFGLLVLAGLILALFGGWLITRAAINPVHNLTKTARAISTTDLSQRIHLTGPHDELFQLGETLNQMLERLEKGFQSQQEFLNAASHDLRTPLSVIRSYTDILIRWGKDDPKVISESLPAIAKAVIVMERLVNDLLLIAKIQSRPSLKLAPVSLPELAEEVIKEAKAITENITIAFKDSTAPPATVEADEFYLRRAFWVLMDNALKYNHPGGLITVNLNQNEKNEAILTVTDTGSGISPTELPKIFERFYRGDLSRSPGKGFGLGLALAKEIVEAHGGKIEVKSEIGRGSAFTMILPKTRPIK
jgi:signal transduction histidine kinase